MSNVVSIFKPTKKELEKWLDDPFNDNPTIPKEKKRLMSSAGGQAWNARGEIARHEDSNYPGKLGEAMAKYGSRKGFHRRKKHEND